MVKRSKTTHSKAKQTTRQPDNSHLYGEAKAVAAFRKQSDLAIGNIVGSCLFNLMIILGGTAMYRPIGISARALELDFPFLIFVTIMLLVIMNLRHKNREDLRRLEGGILVLSFVAYYTLVLFTQTAG